MAKDTLQRRIIDPILAQCPPSITHSIFLRFLFHTHQRTISQYVVVEDDGIEIPGLFCLNGCIPTQGIGGMRHVPCEGKILMRQDITDANLLHLEYKGLVFALTKAEWDALKGSLRLRNGNEEL